MAIGIKLSITGRFNGTDLYQGTDPDKGEKSTPISSDFSRDWIGYAQQIEQSGAKFLVIEDSFQAIPDALTLSAQLGVVTEHLGIIPTVNILFSEPFHTSKFIASNDYSSNGWAGWSPIFLPDEKAAQLFGRRNFTGVTPDDIYQELTDYVSVVSRLWDSWEDDAVIKDSATGRFLDREKLHYVDFSGKFFSIKGPSITPRPPQGQPITLLTSTNETEDELAIRLADVVVLRPTSLDAADQINPSLTQYYHKYFAERVQHITAAKKEIAIYLEIAAVIEDTLEAGLARWDKQNIKQLSVPVLIFTEQNINELTEQGADEEINILLNITDYETDVVNLARFTHPETAAESNLRASFGWSKPVNQFVS